MLGDGTPSGIDTIPVLFIEIAIMTLFKDIPKEVEVKDRFHPLLPVVEKYRLEPPKIGLFNKA